MFDAAKMVYSNVSSKVLKRQVQVEWLSLEWTVIISCYTPAVLSGYILWMWVEEG
jgi:hypothetical protein